MKLVKVLVVAALCLFASGVASAQQQQDERDGVTVKAFAFIENNLAGLGVIATNDNGYRIMVRYKVVATCTSDTGRGTTSTYTSKAWANVGSDSRRDNLNFCGGNDWDIASIEILSVEKQGN